MALDVSYVNNYGCGIDNAALNSNIKLVLNNATQKNANMPEAVIEKNVQSTNSALLFEYTQSIAKSNIAQQLVLDANLKETLKFLNSEAAKKMSQKPAKKFGSIVEQIFADNDVDDFKSHEQKEEENLDFLELYGIELSGKENIFAA